MDWSLHGAAEDRYFWPAVRERLPDGGKLASEASAQELSAGDALARLSRLDPDTDEFDQVVATLIPAARQHIEFEETRVWPALREELSSAEARQLGEKLGRARKAARPERLISA
jgi:hypothetical protein